MFGAFDNVFHVYLMNGLQKNAKKKSGWLFDFEINHIFCFKMHMDRPDKSENILG